MNQAHLLHSAPWSFGRDGLTLLAGLLLGAAAVVTWITFGGHL